jgi:hypothetical protein
MRRRTLTLAALTLGLLFLPAAAAHATATIRADCTGWHIDYTAPSTGGVSHVIAKLDGEVTHDIMYPVTNDDQFLEQPWPARIYDGNEHEIEVSHDWVDRDGGSRTFRDTVTCEKRTPPPPPPAPLVTPPAPPAPLVVPLTPPTNVVSPYVCPQADLDDYRITRRGHRFRLRGPDAMRIRWFVDGRKVGRGRTHRVGTFEGKHVVLVKFSVGSRDCARQSLDRRIPRSRLRVSPQFVG